MNKQQGLIAHKWQASYRAEKTLHLDACINNAVLEAWEAGYAQGMEDAVKALPTQEKEESDAAPIPRL